MIIKKAIKQLNIKNITGFKKGSKKIKDIIVQKTIELERMGFEPMVCISNTH